MNVDEILRKLSAADRVDFVGTTLPDRAQTRRGVYLRARTGVAWITYFLGAEEDGRLVVERAG